MVEIGVCSTVGTSGNVHDIMQNVGVKVRKKAWWKSAATDEERAKTGVKDVVKMVACNAHCKNSP